MKKVLTLRGATLFFIKKIPFILSLTMLFVLIFASVGFYNNKKFQGLSEFDVEESFDYSTAIYGGEESILLSILPENSACYKTLYSVIPPLPDTPEVISGNMDSYKNMYNIYVFASKDNGLLQDLAIFLGISSKQVYDLFSVKQVSNEVFQITTMYSDLETARKMNAFIFEKINASVIKILGEHKVSLLAQSGVDSYSEDVLAIQQALMKNIDALSTTFLPSISSTPKPAPPLSLLKYTLLGFILGAGVSCLLVLFMLTADNHIYKTDIALACAYPFWGVITIPSDNKKKTWYSFIDGLTHKSNNINNLEYSIKLLISRIKLSTSGQSGIKDIVFVGVNDLQIFGDIGNAINANIEIASNALVNADSMQKIADCDGAILIIALGETSYAQANEAISLLQQGKKSLLGVVALEM